MNPKPIDWATYFENTKHSPPAPLLVKALEYVKTKNRAIDIGGGATLKDTKYLLSQGFETTLIDKEKMVETAVLNISSEKLKFFLTDFADFDFPFNKYDIVAAIYSLPFIPPDLFTDVFGRVKKSLVHDGIFCGQFFGDHDGWHLNPRLTFVTKEKAQSMLEDMDIILLMKKNLMVKQQTDPQSIGMFLISLRGENRMGNDKATGHRAGGLFTRWVLAEWILVG